MKKMSAEGKLDKDVTNHSLRSYDVTKMFAVNVPENVIMESSGHRSVEGVRHYERTSALQELQVCKILDSNPPQEPPIPVSLPQASTTQLRPPQPPFYPPLAFKGVPFLTAHFKSISLLHHKSATRISQTSTYRIC